MSEFTKEDLIEIQADHCQPLYYQLLAAFAARQTERAENAEAERDRLREEIETERMRLAACGVLADCNTTGSVAKHRGEIQEKYRSGSLDSVCAAVDREMRLRGELEEAEEAIRRLSWRLCPDCVGDGILGADWKGKLVACESCGGHEDRRGDGWISDTVDNIAETMESPAVRRARERAK